MSRHSRIRVGSSSGFTLVELVVIMVMVGIIVAPLYTFINSSFSQYLSLQSQGTSFTELATQTQRISNVLRGVTDINSVSSDDIDCYAYFAPSDTYVSRIHYYKTADNKKLLADVTRMSANPPQGTAIPNTLVTHTIIGEFHQVTGVNTFTYLDASGAVLPLPITDMRTIKGVQITLATSAGTANNKANQTMTLQVSLRNRKVNL